MTPSTFIIEQGALGPLHVDVHRANAAAPAPAVILLHGFKGFRQWGFLPEVARRLAISGLHIVAIDLSGNGMRGSSDAVVDTEAFRQQTISADVNDVMQVLAWLELSGRSNEILGETWDSRLHFVGHSRGAALALVVASELSTSVKQLSLGRLVLLNSIGTYVRWTPRQRSVWESQGSVDIENARTGQRLAMGFQYVLDIEQNPHRFNLVVAAQNLSGRLRFVHAEQDVTVPLKEIQSLLDQVHQAGALVRIPNTGHTFGIEHPFRQSTAAFDNAMAHTTQWLLQE